MNKIITFLFFTSISLSMCKKDDFPRIETINKGSKWNIHIGDPAATVYSQLQKLGKEKGFNDIDILDGKLQDMGVLYF